MSWELTKQLEENWNIDRPIIKQSNTLEKLVDFLAGEVQEVSQAVIKFLAGETDEKDVLQELADVGIFLMALFRKLDADMMDEVREKIAFNSIRYPAGACQDGEWVEVYSNLKKQAKDENMRDEFYK